jgi:hypothetical protein
VRRRLLITLIAVLAVATPTTALAKPSYPTKLSIKLNIDVRAVKRGAYEWHGRARSDKHACEVGRKVVLYNESFPGPLGNDLTDGGGQWRIVMGADGLTGDYYAKVRREETPNYICKADRSKNYPLTRR